MDKTIAVVSANFGNFDKPIDNVKQNLPKGFRLTEHRFTDEDFPLRLNSMTPRLQARIPKMFSWQMLPDFDYYIWVDSSCHLSSPEAVKWFLDRLGTDDIAVFKHPHRNTVQEEADYLKKRLAISCPYITPRYANELIDEQLREVEPNQGLFASTAFIYRNTTEVQKALKEWWYHTSRFHSIDQLSLPFVVKDLKVKVIQDNYLKSPYLTYTRNQK